VRRTLCYLWASPNTLLGLVLLPLVWLTRGHLQVHTGVLELYGGGLVRLLRFAPVRGGAAAITLGHVVAACSREMLDATRRHERAHVRQCEQWGPFFLPAYFLASLFAAARGRDAYEDNWFERQARSLERH
jgi:hypothetical protein